MLGLIHLGKFDPYQMEVLMICAKPVVLTGVK